MTVQVRGLLAVLALMLGGLASACDQQEKELDAVPGRYSAEPAGTDLTIPVPVGAIRITLGKGVGTVPDDRALDGDEHRASGDQRYVPVSARLEPLGEEGVSEVVAGAALAADLSVEVGGRDVDLATPYKVGSGRVEPAPTLTWVPMTDDERDDLEVAVGYDGLVQRLGADGKAASGSAQPFRDARAGRGDVQDCGGEWKTAPGSRVEVGCSMTPTFTPYLPGVGWADEGRRFVVVDLQLNIIDVRVGDRAVAPGALRLSPSIDVGGSVTPDPAIERALTGTGAGLVSRDFYEMPADQSAVLQLDSQLWGVVASTSVAIEGP